MSAHMFCMYWLLCNLLVELYGSVRMFSLSISSGIFNTQTPIKGLLLLTGISINFQAHLMDVSSDITAMSQHWICFCGYFSDVPAMNRFLLITLAHPMTRMSNRFQLLTHNTVDMTSFPLFDFIFWTLDPSVNVPLHNPSWDGFKTRISACGNTKKNPNLTIKSTFYSNQVWMIEISFPFRRINRYMLSRGEVISGWSPLEKPLADVHALPRTCSSVHSGPHSWYFPTAHHPLHSTQGTLQEKHGHIL